MESSAEGGTGDFAVERRRHEHLHDVHLMREESLQVRVATGVRPLCPAGGDLRLVAVTQRHDLDFWEVRGRR